MIENCVYRRRGLSPGQRRLPQPPTGANLIDSEYDPKHVIYEHDPNQIETIILEPNTLEPITRSINWIFDPLSKHSIIHLYSMRTRRGQKRTTNTEHTVILNTGKPILKVTVYIQ